MPSKWYGGGWTCIDVGANIEEDGSPNRCYRKSIVDTGKRWGLRVAGFFVD